MTLHHPPQAPATAEHGRLLVVVGTALGFLLLGPPIGVITYLGGMIVADIATTVGDVNLRPLLGLPILLLFAIPLSYVFGALPALAAGLLIGLWQAFRGKLVWPAVAALGLAIGGIISFTGLLNLQELGEAPLAVVLATCCAPTLICWYIMRNFTGARIEQNDQSTPAPR
jgi:hypothetical protein